MNRRGRSIASKRSIGGRGAVVAVLAALIVALVLPAVASAHAYLVKTVPLPSQVLNAPPPSVGLTFDEAVEPRFALISVTDASGIQQATGHPSRAPSNPDTLVVRLRPHLREGWYLIYWRAISVDGHPVSGAFTFAVGPDPGPAPRFRVPDISATAITPPLLIARWLMLTAVMASIGLLALRLVVLRLVPREVDRASRRSVSVAFVAASVVGLLVIPAYLDLATANDSLRSAFDIGELVPLFRATAFGRAIVDLELCFALFCFAGYVCLWVDRSERDEQDERDERTGRGELAARAARAVRADRSAAGYAGRSIAELSAGIGAVLAATAVLLLPGTAGHAVQTSPRGATLAFDWVHLAAGSVWLGGLIGLLVLSLVLPPTDRVRSLAAVVPRFSIIAATAVALLAASGIAEAIDHLPTLDSLWRTGYGQAILVKSGLLLLALAVASGNLLRVRPRLAGADGGADAGADAARLLRRLVSAETIVVAGAIFAAAVLSSIAPPPPAFALQSSASVRVGPGAVTRTVTRDGYHLAFSIAPNQAAAPNGFEVRVTRDGHAVRGADTKLTIVMTTMQMPAQEYQLKETRPGVYARSAPALVMVGVWGLRFAITPRSGPPLNVFILDQANG